MERAARCAAPTIDTPRFRTGRTPGCQSTPYGPPPSAGPRISVAFRITYPYGPDTGRPVSRIPKNHRTTLYGPPLRAARAVSFRIKFHPASRRGENLSSFNFTLFSASGGSPEARALLRRAGRPPGRSWPPGRLCRRRRPGEWPRTARSPTGPGGTWRRG